MITLILKKGMIDFAKWLILISTGIVSSATGLASLVSYPILLALGLPPVVANVTNTYSLFFAEFGATLSSHKELHGQQHDLSTCR